jgi:hypothetical protein
MLMLFNAWRLNTIHTSSKFVLSEQCVSLKQLRQARYHFGKTCEQFLKILYDNLKLPVFLRQGGTDIEDALSPQRPQTDRKVTYKTCTVCMRCEVALCRTCFRPWHEEMLMPSLPTDSTETIE